MSDTFYIIDGHAQIFRAYYAPFRDLSSPTGEPTKATFVFLQRLLNLIENRKPDYLAMVIDTGDAELERRRIDPQYKANRKPPPPDFEPQEKRILQLVGELGIPIFAMPGHEADDLIATMARRLTEQHIDAMIVSNDKDLRQLVNEHIRMYDVYNDVVIDAALIREKHGYSPHQAVEVQTLVGDATDNVPGIPGIGEKTAAKLIRKYGSADELLKHLDDLTPAMKRNLTENAAILKISRPLVTLRTDLPLDWDVESCRFKGVNQAALRSNLQNLGFHTLLKRLGDSSGPAPPQPAAAPPSERFDEQLFGSSNAAPAVAEHFETCADCSYKLVRTPQELDAFIKELKQQPRFAFDTETDALGAMNSKLVGMSFSWKERTGYYLPVRGPAGWEDLNPPAILAGVKHVLEDATIKKVGHNIKYDLMVMRRAGIHVAGVALDSMVATFLLDAGRMTSGIDRLALDLLNFKKIPTSDLIGEGKGGLAQRSMADIDPARVATYAAEDADIAWRLSELLARRLDALPDLRKLADDLETPLVYVLADMEFNGIAVDPSVLKEQSAVLSDRIETLRAEICQHAGRQFNCDSPKQLADILYVKLQLPVPKRTKTGPSTDIEALEKLGNSHPILPLIRDYRALVKLKNTYLDKLTDFINPETGRIHAHFNQIGAETGRLSCSDPNLQNIPIRTDEGNRIRLAFVPGDRTRNVLLSADYSQIELRLLAHFTQEPALMRAFEADEDIHTAVAAEVFGLPLHQITKDQRAQAKVINFGIIYGVTAYGLSWRIDGLSVKSADALIKAYHQRFPAISGFFDQCVDDVRRLGYVQTILGRRRPIPDISSGVANIRNQAERQAINSVVQGSAADLIKLAMLNIHRRLARENRPSRLLLQVHDELVFETPISAVEADAGLIRREMTEAMQLKVPLKVEIKSGKNWQEAK